MSFAGYLILFGLTLISLASAIYGLIEGSDRKHTFYIIWTVLAAILVYIVMITAFLAFYRKRFRDQGLAATHEEEALDRTDDIFHAHAHHDFRTEDRRQRNRTQTSSATTSSTTLQSPLKTLQRSKHPGPLSSNPPDGPPCNLAYLPPLPTDLSDLARSMPAFHTAATITVTSAKSQAIQVPARARAATDAGQTTAAVARSRTRANSLMQIKEATARRMMEATPTTPPRVEGGTFEYDS